MERAVFIQLVVGLLIGGGLGAVLGYVGKCTTGACPFTANPWRGGIAGAVVGSLFAFSAGSPRSGVQATSSSTREVIGPAPSSQTPPDMGSPATPIHIGSAEAFERIIQTANQPVLVDFYADWCGPCRMLAPTIEKLAKEYQGRVLVAKVNVDDLSAVAGRYGIQGIPAVLVFQNGKEAQRLVGLRPAGDYAKVLDKLLGQTP
jgi:thioredoxin 1